MLQTITAAIVLIGPLMARSIPVLADAADNHSLIISQLRITGNRLIALSGTVPPHGYFMIKDACAGCGARATIRGV